MKKALVLLGGIAIATTAFAAWLSAERGNAQRQPATPSETQTVLGPGLYVFQTRLDHSSCEQRSTS